MNIHPHVPEPAQPIIEDYISAVNFLKYIIHVCNTSYPLK